VVESFTSVTVVAPAANEPAPAPVIPSVPPETQAS